MPEAPTARDLRGQIAGLFQNYRFEKVDLDRHSELVILTVLRLGSWAQILATAHYYGRARLEEVVRKDFFGNRTLPASVRAFWGNIFFPGVPLPEQVDPMEHWRQTRTVPAEPS
ncbi:MAG: DUF6922 domain-containing protein [Acidimicrobiales bacterium]